MVIEDLRGAVSALAGGRCDVISQDGAGLATWIEFGPLREDATGGRPESRAQFKARRIERDGTRSAPVTVSSMAGSRASGYPRAAIANGEVVFAWTEAGAAGALQVRTAASKLP